MSKPTGGDVRAGQAIYTRPVLALYDWLVLGVSNHLIWRCPTAQLRALYQAHVTANHLEVGVGTGYFLDRCRFPTPQPRLTLLDLNRNCLNVTSQRLRRYHPQVLCANILEAIPFEGELFDSVGLNYVLHCLPGGIEGKAVAFDHLLPLLRPGGVLFGSTLLGRGPEVNWLARQLMRVYNTHGFFANAEDSLDSLRTVLRDRFTESKVETIGCAALVVARK